MSKASSLFTKTELKQLLQKKNSCVVVKNAVIEVFLAPCYLNDIVAGFKHALNKKLKTYDSKLEGIILGYDKIKVALDAGRFAGRNAEIRFPVTCDCYVFQPLVGSLLEGFVNRTSDDHIGCVCHNYFNATIKRPESEGYDNWNRQSIYVNQSITFRVKDLDYTGLIPIIVGEFAELTKNMPEKQAALSENGVNLPENNNKRKKGRTDLLVNSTLIQTKVSNYCSNSGLDFDFLSPIATVHSPVPEPTKSPAKKRKKKEGNDAGIDELREMLLQQQLHSLKLDPITPSKKRKKKDSVHAPEPKKVLNVGLSEPTIEDLKPVIIPHQHDGSPNQISKTLQSKPKSPKKASEKNGEKSELTGQVIRHMDEIIRNVSEKTDVINPPAEENTAKPPKKKDASSLINKVVKSNIKDYMKAPSLQSETPAEQNGEKSKKKTSKKNVELSELPEQVIRHWDEIIKSVSEGLDVTDPPAEENVAKPPNKKKDSPLKHKAVQSKLQVGRKAPLLEPKTPAEQNGEPPKKKPRTPAVKKPSAKKDPTAKKMEFYLKKLGELAMLNDNQDLLQNMLNSSILASKVKHEA